MLPFKIKTGLFKKPIRINLPTRWGELSVEQMEAIVLIKDDPDKLFEILTGYKGITGIEAFIPYMNWITKAPDLEDFEEFPAGVDICEKKFGQLIRFHLALNKLKGDNPKSVFSISAELCSIYLGRSEYFYRKQRLDKIVPLARGLISQYKALREKEQKTLSRKQEAEEVEAGAAMFEPLGHFNTIDMLAKNYGYTHQEAEDLEYNVVYLVLLRNNISYKFEKNLATLKRRKNGV